MENMKKEILRILFVFGVQVIVGFLFFFFTKILSIVFRKFGPKSNRLTP